MELSVNAILETIDDFLKESGTRTYRALVGLEPFTSSVELCALLGDVTHAEPVSFVRELTTSARIDATKKGRVERLLATLLELSARTRLAPHDDAISQVLRGKTISSNGRAWTLSEALRDGWTLTSPEGRAQLASERAAVLSSEHTVFARRVDALAEAAVTLGLGSARALVEAIERRQFSKAEPQAEALLQASADPARDLTSFVLKRVDPALKVTTARTIDLERALAAPWLFELLRQEDLPHAVTRTLSELGFHPNAFGKIQVDAEPTPGRTPGAHLLRLEVPDQLRLVFTAAPGFEGYTGWLGAWGEAQLLAATPRTLPFIDRSIGDGALALAVRKLFESLLLDEGWLKRAVRVTSAQAREIARLFAWRQVMELRHEAALVTVSRELLERGPVKAMIETASSAMSRARFVQPEGGRSLVDVAPLAPRLASLDAWALEAHLVHVMRERFNEDWWRNPAAGRFLTDLAARGTTDDATTVAASLGRSTLEFIDASRRRVVVMGA
ncbi:MAG: hypothetical protein Q8N26_21125 [Myxococcales bacterium]|nr:hypothetical protein [Myxococcales bacterium]